MRRSMVVTLVTLLAAAPLVSSAAETTASDPMAGWKPPKVKNEKQDRAEIAKLFRQMEAAMKKGDIEAAASLIEFPVLMLTDDSKGEAHAATWSREEWVKEMEPFYKPMPDMTVKDKPTVFLLSDSLATVTNIATITMGKKTMTARNSMLLARVGGDWKVKAMVEGGWGDMMAGDAAASSGGGSGTTTPSSTSTSTGATSTTPGATPPISDQPATSSPSATDPSAPRPTTPSDPTGAPTAPGEKTPPTDAAPPPSGTR